jgi:hypothetical protein
MEIEKLQKIVNAYFDKVKPDLTIEVVSRIVYCSKISKPATKVYNDFLDANGLRDAFEKQEYDQVPGNSQYFPKASRSESSMVGNIRMCMLSISYHLLVNNYMHTPKVKKSNKAGFNFIKNQALECYDVLNRNDQFFYGPEEDLEIVNKIKNTTYE